MKLARRSAARGRESPTRGRSSSSASSTSRRPPSRRGRGAIARRSPRFPATRTRWRRSRESRPPADARSARSRLYRQRRRAGCRCRSTQRALATSRACRPRGRRARERTALVDAIRAAAAWRTACAPTSRPLCSTSTTGGRRRTRSRARGRAYARAAERSTATTCSPGRSYRNGRCGEALAHSKRALRLGTLDALKLFHRGMIERCLGHDAERATWFARAPAREPALLAPLGARREEGAAMKTPARPCSRLWRLPARRRVGAPARQLHRQPLQPRRAVGRRASTSTTCSTWRRSRRSRKATPSRAAGFRRRSRGRPRARARRPARSPRDAGSPASRSAAGAEAPDARFEVVSARSIRRRPNASSFATRTSPTDRWKEIVVTPGGAGSSSSDVPAESASHELRAYPKTSCERRSTSGRERHVRAGRRGWASDLRRGSTPRPSEREGGFASLITRAT